MTSIPTTGSITVSGTPLELFGINSGPTAIDPATILTRQWYFDGKFLRAEAFRRDQAYVRNLVALSNTAVGHGVVNGFTALRADGDTIRVEPGLALAPSGRPILLTGPKDLSIAELIEHATGKATGRTSGAFGSATFGACVPREGEPDEPGGTGPIWVLYARGIEVPCGQEERFGQLCENACASESDHATVVEGVGFFVEAHPLPLPTSFTVSFTGRHLRNRYASAYYAWERARTPSFISGAGLRTDVWCAGAPGVDGDAVPLAVFDRAGGLTSFVDAWTARRELIETNPQRYWHWRTARRPWDVFLAQVLQFQCQLIGTPTDGRTPTDDCADEREALAEANEVLAGLSDAFRPEVEHDLPLVEAFEAEQPADFRLPPEAFMRIDALRQHVTNVLAAGGLAHTGSLLVDRGFVEVPSAGYLPTDPEHDVVPQVRAFFGPGVDLRFCAVRPDFIGEALAEAQHMDRISLTQGLDDPGNLEEVDVLVPDGEITTEPVATSTVFEGSVQLRPRTKQTDDGAVSGALAELAAVAREHQGDGWSWTLAANGEVTRLANLPKLFAATLADAKVPEAEDALADEEAVAVPFVPRETLAEKRRSPEAWQRLNREKYLANSRRSRIDASAFDNQFGAVAVGEDMLVDRALGQGDDRPFALWFDISITKSLPSLAIGQSTPAHLRLVIYSRSKTEPVTIDVRVDGTLKVTDVTTGQAGGQIADAATVVTELTGQVDPLFAMGSTATIDRPPSAIDPVQLAWQVGTKATGGRTLILSAGDLARALLTLKATDESVPRHIAAGVGLTVVGPAHTIHDDGAANGFVELFRLVLDQLPGGFDSSATARVVGDTTIDIIGAQLAPPDRDPSFAVSATERLFGDDQSEAQARIGGRRDWVFFHRRRTKVCGVVDTPVRTRRYRLHHATIDDRRLLAHFRDLWGVSVQPQDVDEEAAEDELREILVTKAFKPVSSLGFVPVGVLEFEERTGRMVTPAAVLRTAWSAADRGDTLVLNAGGDLGVGDGENVLRARLSTVRGAIADLITITSATTKYLTDVPPEFHDSGLDGVLFTVGLSEPVVEEAGCIELIRTTRGAGALLEQMLDAGDLDNADVRDLIAILEEHGLQVDRFVVRFDAGHQILNGADLRHWWGPGAPSIGFPFIGLAALDTGEGDLYRDRAEAIAQEVGTMRLADGRPIESTGDCGAAIIVIDGTPDLGTMIHGFAFDPR